MGHMCHGSGVRWVGHVGSWVILSDPLSSLKSRADENVDQDSNPKLVEVIEVG